VKGKYRRYMDNEVKKDMDRLEDSSDGKSSEW
jgi:hypothetical protein